MSILDNLNEKQQEAARKIDGQTLILAGAGSGKTRTITFKIAHMIKEKGISPKNILALTFTNKAAREMKERVEALIGSNSDILISTFHSFSVKLLRMYSERIGYGTNFNIYDTSDQKTLIKKILKDNNLENTFKPGVVINQISRLKELGLNYTTMGNQVDLRVPINQKLKTVFQEYQENLEKNNSMDFSDLLVNAKALLDDPYVLERIQNKYVYILIDEYQDTNEIQYQMVKKIANKYKNICVVGDEDQSIYSFRGANIQNILNFENDYPNASVIKLEQNYRSTQNILNAANSVIKNNNSSKGKKLWSANNLGEKVKVFKASNNKEEAEFIAEKILDLKASGKDFSKFCILYRTNAQSRAIEEAFMKNKIPFKLFGGLQFFERREIKDLISYLLLINNIKDDLSFERVINTPKRAIGPKTIDSLAQIAKKNNTSLFEAIDIIEDQITGSAKNKFISFKNMINELKENITNITTSDLLKELIEKISYFDYLTTLENSDERRENINELINSITFSEQEIGFLSLQDYLENISLNSAIDNLNEDEDYVKLMTIHSSKGLEFNTVFLTGLEEGLFPRDDLSPDDPELEEERRIFYVALTRAEENLFLTHALERTKYGNHFLYGVVRSRFLDEIDEDILEDIHNPNMYKYQKTMTELSKTPAFREYTQFITENKINTTPKTDINIGYKVGEKVFHNTYGEGTIKQITEKSVVVQFLDGEKKIATKLVDKFLRKVGK